ncbi:MAG: dihydrodipicolinate synthase family protein, partial [Actinobacteria bacterium]|nr:dihydrodipicolinate synthase family protein [Actinomycetota bacterium]
AESVDIPIFLYNIPFFANEVTPQIAQKLASIPNVIGIKDSSGSMVNLMNLLDMTHKVNPNFKVLVGAEEMFYPALLMGAEGCMTAMSGIMPEFMVGIYKAFKDGNYQLAHNLQFAILHIIREMKSVNFPQGFKEAMSVRGFKMGAPRMSYPPQTLAKFKSLRDDLGASMGNLLSKYFPGAPLRYEKEVSFMQKFSYPQRQIQVAESGLKKHDSCTVCGMCEGNTYRNAINKPISELAKQTSVDNGVQTILDENLREIIASVTKRILGEK